MGWLDSTADFINGLINKAMGEPEMNPAVLGEAPAEGYGFQQTPWGLASIHEPGTPEFEAEVDRVWETGRRETPGGLARWRVKDALDNVAAGRRPPPAEPVAPDREKAIQSFESLKQSRGLRQHSPQKMGQLEEGLLPANILFPELYGRRGL